MKKMPLTGLTGSSPLGVLASYGLLRLCQQVPDLLGTKLSWRWMTESGIHLDDPTAELTLPNDIDGTEFVRIISDHIQKKDFSIFSWGDDVRVEQDLYRQMLVSKILVSDRFNREQIDILASLGSEIVKDAVKGKVKPSPLYMTAGQQKFLKIITEIIASMHNRTEDAIKEALFGPWKYADDFYSLGWDPSTERLHALREKAPTSEQVKCVRAAIYLATESLALFPTVVLPGIKLTAIGFTRDKNGHEWFVWPLWSPPVGVDTLKSILSLTEIYSIDRNRASLDRRGIFAVYRSERWEFGKGYAIFRPASVVWSK